MLNGLSLFSGIGGLDVALSEWVRPVAYCEIDTYCQGVLLSRMVSGELAYAPIWDDICTLEIGEKSLVDILFGGFPCQGFSVAGLGKGLADERSGLFFEIVRLAKYIRPKFIFLENVPAICSRGGLQITQEVAQLGYDCRWGVMAASSFGALHRRKRWFLLAYSNEFTSGRKLSKLFEKNETVKKSEKCWENQTPKSTYGSSTMAHTERPGLEGYQCETAQTQESEFRHGSVCNTDSQPSEQADSRSQSQPLKERAWGRPSGQHWPFESRKHWQEAVYGVCRTSDGVSFQVDRIKCLGNAVVPIQAKQAFKILIGLK